MQKPRFLIADDHPLTREAVKALLEPVTELIGTAQDGRALLDLAHRTKPEGIVTEIALPGLNGIDVAKKVRALQPKVKIVFYTRFEQTAYVRESFRAGGSAYVSKTSESIELVKAVEAVLRDKQFISAPGTSTNIASTESAEQGRAAFRELTARQREVLQFVAKGKSAKMIAADLNISVKTVEFHKASMMERLSLHTTAELVRYSVESGFLVDFLQDE